MDTIAAGAGGRAARGTTDRSHKGGVMHVLGRHRKLVMGAALAVASIIPISGAPVVADHTPVPASVTIAGSLQSELGCGGDWDPSCSVTHLAYDSGDTVWQGTWSVPAGSWEYKAALDDAWDENYGAGAQPNGANIGLSLADPADVKFYYDHATHWVTDDVTSIIATVPGSFQSEIGCPGDWDPGCLRSWLQDPDGDGTYTFETTSIPAGSYEAKVAIDEKWDENYGAGGAPGGANIAFTVTADATVTFSWDSATKVLTIDVEGGGSSQDGNVEWDGLRHDSRDLLYRTPGGAVPAGTPVTIRFRTFHDDVTDVKLRVYSLQAAAQRLVPMTPAAADVSCYQDDLTTKTCDYWSATLDNVDPDNLWYRFVVTDGASSAYYGDDTAALDGGVGAPTAGPVDQSWALMVHDPSFTVPDWVNDAVIYQIFPDRFRNGRKNNDPETGDVRYDDPVIELPWGTLPEGYCRNYADADATTCPWRFSDPIGSEREQPRGRDYMGGDLKGIDQQLDYLQSLGVTTIYLNPIFDAGSNHSYDTQDFTRVDPYFGTQKDFDNLVKHMDQRGMRLVLDGVFNHMSSDSPFFDRYGHYDTVGACESGASPYRDWFHFREPRGTEVGVCAPSTPGGTDTYYESWFGFDSIPVLDKTNPDVGDYFVSGPDSITTRWLDAGASGWRMDVMGDASFPDGYWEDFRDVVKQADPDAVIISETWQKDSTLLEMLRGDRADATMNYRLRDAIIGLLAPQPFDSKGFADSGYQILPSQFANRIASIQEDYPAEALFAAMNLLDSHDTERLLWTLTPGAETRAERELDPANVAEGTRRVQLASLLQYSMPGAPTVFYGDEVGLTGDDDPDDRRTYPWADLGGSPDTAMLAHYQALGALRAEHAVLREGDLRVLGVDDAAGTVAIGRTTGTSAAITIVNRSDAARTVEVPVAGYLPDGVTLDPTHVVGGSSSSATVTGGVLSVEVPALGGVLLTATGIDLTPPDAPAGLAITAETATEVSIAWNPVPGAAGYEVLVSPVTGGGYVPANATPITDTAFSITGLTTGSPVFVVVRALDDVGNAGGYSNEVRGLPRYAIGWANLQWPPTLTHTISAIDRTDDVYGQVWIDGVTSLPGPTPTLRAQLGYGPTGTAPDGNPDWHWVDATFNTDAGNNDEFVASLLPDAIGTFGYLYRYSTTGGAEWLYADLSGPLTPGAEPVNPGVLTVVSSGDTIPPATPTGLRVVSAAPTVVELAWDPVADAVLYEVLRGPDAAGPLEVIATTSSPSFADSTVTEGQSYAYEVRSVDASFNRSAPTDPVIAEAAARTVSVTFMATVPATTDGTGLDVHIAGTLDRLDGGLPAWDPGGVQLTRVDATHWIITLTGREGTQVEYKYTLGSWDFVEKDGACGEIANRQLTLAYGANGTQTVDDTVPNWRNVSPCGN
jgi:glycosidase